MVTDAQTATTLSMDVPPRLLPALTSVDVAFAASCASAAGALFIIANWLCNRAARRLFFLRLIVFLAVANLLSACAYAMSFVEWRILGRGSPTPVLDENLSGAWCLVQATLLLFFETASVLWTVALAAALHQQVVARRAAPERMERWFHLVCWGAPCALTLALLFSRSLGPADEPRTAWCWIASGAAPLNHTTPHAMASRAGGGGGGGPALLGGGSDGPADGALTGAAGGGASTASSSSSLSE